MLFLAAWLPGQTVDALRRAFERPPAEARIMMRWWWFGPAVEKDELEREMVRMQEGGIGGFEIQPVYPLELDGNLKYLSPEFLEALRFTAAKAKELGLRMDLTLGSGWPFGGPHIPIEHAAARLRVVRGTEPQLREGETLIATAGATSFVASHTRQMVKRASVGAEGLVLDHCDRAALDLHLKHVGEPLLDALAAERPYAVFCDSLEVFGADWTPDFLEQFQKRRGYDLKPHLPALAGDAGASTGAVRNDWVETLSELAQERFLVPLQAWARSHGTRLRIQNYGSPPVTLASNALLDLPEGEGSYWKRFTTSRWASSAAHLLGRSVVSSETWTWLHSPAFRATPLDMKAEADRHFLEGITQLVGHGWPYSPERAGEPGWRFYAAAVFNHHNPWWIVMPDVTAYLQRVSFLLRQGRPVADVAVYLPSADVRATTRLGEASIDRGAARLLNPAIVPQILDAGFNFDFVDDGLILQYGRVEKGALAFPGARYRIMVLPDVERIPVEVYRKLERFARAGGILVATGRVPALAPGLQGAEKQSEEVRAISRELFGSGTARLIAHEKLGERLAAMLPPDAVLSPDIGFVHRAASGADIYFVVNTTSRAQSVNAKFRAARGRRPEQWDPFTGRTRPAALAFELAPYESRIFVFSGAGPRPAAVPRTASGASLDLATGWNLAWPDPFFSGVAKYEKTISVPAGMLGGRVLLDFGKGTAVAEQQQRQPGMRAWLDAPVRDAAVVYVNGKRAGSVWRPPYRVDVTARLHAGRNTIRIEVANTAINILARGPLPDHSALHARYGRRFDPQDMENLKPLPSGLLGPVRLISESGLRRPPGPPPEAGYEPAAGHGPAPQFLRRRGDANVSTPMR